MIISSIFILFSTMALGQNMDQLLYKSGKFSIYTDRVIQGNYSSIAKSANHLISDYQSPADVFFNPALNFKYSINGKDNEIAVGESHHVLLKPENGKAIIVRTIFGNHEKDNISTEKPEFLPVNSLIIFELDMRPVLNAFEKDGYYIDYQGNRIYQSDFKGVWIAGGTEPLSWDFENLPNNEALKMMDTDGDGIYTREFIFNPLIEDRHKINERIIQSDLSKYPGFISSQLITEILYNLSLEEMIKDIRPDQTFMAGKEWNGVWTRDISYSILLSLAILEPEIAKNSLMRKVKNKRIIQDTGTGGSWPCSTDRQTWALAAWEVFKFTGDKKWLKTAYEIISNSMEDDIKVAFNPSTGLFYGESSFLDWRKQTYPVWMEPIDIYLSQNLGTNAVFYQTLNILGEMGELLSIKNAYTEKAEALKNSINKYLWLEKQNYYSQYLYGHYHYSSSPRSEGLGEALCLLFEIADKDKAKNVLENTPVMEFGIPCIYPQIPDIPPYHNRAVWPFVQAYWTWAGARAKNSSVVEHGMASIYRQAALFLTNKENMVADNGDFKGTEINSDRQLWSVAGNLAMVYRIFFGMDFQADRLIFKPFVPKAYQGEFQLKNFKYRNSILNIKISGYGNGIESITFDGKKSRENFINSSLKGNHSIVIILNSKMDPSQYKLSENKMSPRYPDLRLEKNQLSWNDIKNAKSYKLFHNGEFYKEIDALTSNFQLDNTRGEYQVLAVDSNETESFLSKPLLYVPENKIIKIEAEQFGKTSVLNSSGFSGSGFVELSLNDAKAFSFDISVPLSGEYLIEFRYANGSGPINTDNKCGIRALYCNSAYSGAAIFPQRGKDEWSNWGISNPISVKLNKGLNKIELRNEKFTQNMNGEVNRFYLDQIILIDNTR